MSRVPKRYPHRQPSLQILYVCVGSLALWVAGALSPSPARALPPGFVTLEAVAPAIVQEMRYAGPANFTGKVLPGYGAPKCWLVEEAALALLNVDTQLRSFGLGLKVWDCYRPVRASVAMVEWGKDSSPLSATERYFLGPLTRSQVLANKFVAPQSKHNHGSTVDVTIIDRNERARPLNALPARGTRCEKVDEPMTFGTAHDCFHAQSATRAADLTSDVRAHRALLKFAMRQAGFVNYAKEWWHYTLLRPPATAQPSDMPIR